MRAKATPYITIVGLSFISISALTSCGGKPDDILISSETPIASKLSEANTSLAQAQAYQNAGKAKKAISAYNSVAKKYPFSNAASEARFAQAQLLDQRGDLFEAFEAYQDLIQKHQSSRHYSSAIKRQEEIAHSAADGIITNNFLGLKTKINPSRTVSMLNSVRNNAPSAPSASHAQYTIGRVHQQNKDYARSLATYKQMAVDYPYSKEAPEALYQTGEILIIKAEKGNQNRANVNQARDIYSSLIDQYPRHARAKDARNRIAELGGQEIQRNYDTAEFYRKKGKTKSAIFYYNEVLRQTKSGTLRDRSQQRINELGG